MERMSSPTYSEIKKLDKKLYNKQMEVYDRIYVLEEDNKRLEEDNKRLEEENEEFKGQVKEPYLLFVKTIWMIENKSGFYIFRNIKNNNYELRLFNLAGTYPLNNCFDTVEGAIEYIEIIKSKN